MYLQAAKIAGSAALKVGAFLGLGYVLGVGQEYGRHNTAAKLRADKARSKKGKSARKR